MIQLGVKVISTSTFMLDLELQIPEADARGLPLVRSIDRAASDGTHCRAADYHVRAGAQPLVEIVLPRPSG